MQAFVRNVGTHTLMPREYIKRLNSQDKSTDAVCGGRPSCSSKEVSVMEMERRPRNHPVSR